MKEFKSNWWSLQIPDEWFAENDETSTTFACDDGVGALQVSAARNSNGPATENDLKDFAKEHFDAGAPIASLNCGTFTGFHLNFSVDGMFQRQWWLRCEDTVVFATYTCDPKFKGKEDDVVDSILKTLAKS